MSPDGGWLPGGGAALLGGGVCREEVEEKDAVLACVNFDLYWLR